MVAPALAAGRTSQACWRRCLPTFWPMPCATHSLLPQWPLCPPPAHPHLQPASLSGRASGCTAAWWRGSGASSLGGRSPPRRVSRRGGGGGPLLAKDADGQCLCPCCWPCMVLHPPSHTYKRALPLPPHQQTVPACDRMCAGAGMDELLASVKKILDIYVANGYALKASLIPGSTGGGSGRASLSPVDGSGAAAAGSSFTVKLEGPANLWSLQVCRGAAFCRCSAWRSSAPCRCPAPSRPPAHAHTPAASLSTGAGGPPVKRVQPARCGDGGGVPAGQRSQQHLPPVVERHRGDAAVDGGLRGRLGWAQLQLPACSPDRVHLHSSALI